MPLYEYVCTTCENRYEDLVSSSSAKSKCPKCESRHVKKQLSVFATSSSESASAAAPAMGGCGSCGDPRGPGSCRN